MSDIFERQEQDWNEYFQAYDKSKSQLHADEMLIRKHFGFNDKNLPAEWRDMIDRQRQAWVDEWGIKGRRKTELSARHAREFKSDNQPRLTEHMHPELTQPKDTQILSNDNSTRSPMADIQAPQQTAQWNALVNECNAIESAYKARQEPIPEATQKRMAKRIVGFKQQWQGFEPDTPLKDWKTLKEADFKNQFQSFRDLTQSHNIIEAYYGHPDKVPAATDKALAQEVEEYHREIDQYQAENRNMARQDFKTRLQTIRENQLQLKHKPQ